MPRSLLRFIPVIDGHRGRNFQRFQLHDNHFQPKKSKIRKRSIRSPLLYVKDILIAGITLKFTQQSISLNQNIKY